MIHIHPCTFCRESAQSSRHGCACYLEIIKSFLFAKRYGLRLSSFPPTGGHSLRKTLHGMHKVAIEGTFYLSEIFCRCGGDYTSVFFTDFLRSFHHVQINTLYYLRMVFKDRFEAGRKLADMLYPAYQYQHVKVVALPNGGVPVGYEIAKRFGVPLEVLVSKKLSAPNNPEFGVGAISE